MTALYRLLLLWGCNLVLYHVSGLFNHALSGLPIYWLLIGPMLILPAAYLSYKSMLLCLLMTGLWIDASIPSQLSGFFTVNLLILGSLIYRHRKRFHFEHNFHPVILAMVANAYLIVALSMWTLWHSYWNSEFAILALISLVASQLVLPLLAMWFFSFQRCLIQHFQLAETLHAD
jgi:hypothetical protein